MVNPERKVNEMEYDSLFFDITLILKRIVQEQATCERSGKMYFDFMQKEISKVEKKFEKIVDKRLRPERKVNDD